MEEQRAKSQKFWVGVLVLVLWLVTFGLGLEAMYGSLQLFYVIFGSLGGNVMKVERFAMALIFFLGIGFTVFIIGSAEYHRKHVGTRKSWRLLIWTIVIEAGITILYLILQ